MHLILASTSPWRLQMLTSAGLSVSGVAPGVSEETDEPEPARRAVLLAERKVMAVVRDHPRAWVLGGDQVVTDGARIWGKPSGPEDHLAQLRALRGASHDLVSGWCLHGPGVHEVGSAVTTMVGRADLTDAELRAYVATGEGSGCAGGYAVEGRGCFLFERYEGDWFTILGLPLLDVMGALRRHGWRFGETP